MQIEIPSKSLFHSISEFRFMRELGVGSFGKVKLAIHKGTRKKYAIKIIDLNGTIKQNELLIIEREIKIHTTIDHPHIIKLWDTLRDDRSIYMVMDYASNGSLFRYHSQKLSQGQHPELSQVYQFFFQSLQAVSYLHSRDLMHRDIKPQNLLLDEDLNIKLCDFGWATSQITSERCTFCGTYEYMAPEMVLEKTYDYRIDIWALGVLLYELVHGKAPFPAQNLKEMKENIKKGSYEIGKITSQYLRNLIIQILQFSPEKRLTIPQIQSHAWIKICQNFTDENDNEKRKHHYQKSMDNFLTLKNQLQADQTLKTIDMLSGENKKEKKNQKILLNRKNYHLGNSMQTDANMINQSSGFQLKKIKKKCKTQGEEEIDAFQKQFGYFPKKNDSSVLFVGLDAAQTKRSKAKKHGKPGNFSKWDKNDRQNVPTKLTQFRPKSSFKKSEKAIKSKNQRFGDLSTKFFKDKTLGLTKKHFPS